MESQQSESLPTNTGRDSISLGGGLLGVMPCPTTIFTFGPLPYAGGSRLTVLVIPQLWSIIASTATMLSQVPQNYGLLRAGILGFVRLIVHP